MSPNAETEFLNFLIELSARSEKLRDQVDKAPANVIERELSTLTSYWELLNGYSQQHGVDTSKYTSEIFEIRKNHRYIALVLETKPRGFFDKYRIEVIAKRLEMIVGFLRFFGFYPIGDLLLQVLRNIAGLLPSPTPRHLLLPPNPILYNEKQTEGFNKAASINVNQNTRPPKPQEKYMSERTPDYVKFSTTRTLLSQDIIHKNRKGIMVDIDMFFNQMANINCKVQLSYWLANGKPIRNRHEAGQAKIETSVIPNSESYEMKNAKFFMAYKRLSLGIGLYKCKVRINAIRSDNGQVLGNLQEIFFELSDPGSENLP